MRTRRSASIPSGGDREPRPLITEQEAVEHFREALSGGRPLRVTDESSVASCALSRTTFCENPDIVATIDAAIILSTSRRSLRPATVPAHRAAHCEPALTFFAFAVSIRRRRTFHLLAAWVTKAEAKRLIPIAEALAMKKDVGDVAKWRSDGLILCQPRNSDLRTARGSRLLGPGLVPSLIMPAFPVALRGVAPRSIANFLERTTVEPGLAFRYRAMKHRETCELASASRKRAPSQVLNAFVELGMVPGIPAPVDALAEFCVVRCASAKTPVWRVFLGSEYAHALRRLKHAEKLIDVGRFTMAELPKLVRSCRVPEPFSSIWIGSNFRARARRQQRSRRVEQLWHRFVESRSGPCVDRVFVPSVIAASRLRARREFSPAVASWTSRRIFTMA